MAPLLRTPGITRTCLGPNQELTNIATHSGRNYPSTNLPYRQDFLGNPALTKACSVGCASAATPCSLTGRACGHKPAERRHSSTCLPPIGLDGPARRRPRAAGLIPSRAQSCAISRHPSGFFLTSRPGSFLPSAAEPVKGPAFGSYPSRGASSLLPYASRPIGTPLALSVSRSM